jgi:hypothetical protein
MKYKELDMYHIYIVLDLHMLIESINMYSSNETIVLVIFNIIFFKKLWIGIFAILNV